MAKKKINLENLMCVNCNNSGVHTKTTVHVELTGQTDDHYIGTAALIMRCHVCGAVNQYKLITEEEDKQ